MAERYRSSADKELEAALGRLVLSYSDLVGQVRRWLKEMAKPARDADLDVLLSGLPDDALFKAFLEMARVRAGTDPLGTARLAEVGKRFTQAQEKRNTLVHSMFAVGDWAEPDSLDYPGGYSRQWAARIRGRKGRGFQAETLHPRQILDAAKEIEDIMGEVKRFMHEEVLRWAHRGEASRDS